MTGRHIQLSVVSAFWVVTTSRHRHCLSPDSAQLPGRRYYLAATTAGVVSLCHTAVRDL